LADAAEARAPVLNNAAMKMNRSFRNLTPPRL
jgi:hypothetical protein